MTRDEIVERTAREVVRRYPLVQIGDTAIERILDAAGYFKLHEALQVKDIVLNDCLNFIGADGTVVDEFQAYATSLCARIWAALQMGDKEEDGK